MGRLVRAYFGRHARFYLAGVLGIIVWTASGMLVQQLRLLIAADTFFGVYLLLVTMLVVRATPDELRKLAGIEDEGIILIVLIALTAICFSLVSIFALLNRQQELSAVHLLLALASAPLG